jgi:diguanylate cyclase (GGDEF)-like protein
VRHQATTDDLTGLPNRRAFAGAVETEVATASADRGFALLLVDLDRFKEVNDLLGHHIGDRLLREIGPRLSPMLRAADVLGRLGGDEFGVVLPGADQTTAVGIARRLSEALAIPFTLDGMSQQIAGSIGVALWPTHSDNAHGLLQCADIAMYAAKSHRTGVEVYDPVHGTEGRTRLALAKQLTPALSGDQFVLHYQPKLDLRTGEVVGVEALVRWQHPDLGLLYPDAFLPIAEQIGCMDLLTRTVLAAAVAQGRQWRLDGLDLTVAVNLSASNLVNDELVHDIALILARENFPAAALTLEITESTLVSDGPRALAILDAIHDLGITLSVDDYGTGFGSLTYIRDLPVQELKIDRTFVTSLTTGSRDATIVKSTIDLAHALGLHVVAEGIENAEAQTLLTQLGCNLAQGYHLGRPKGADELTAWLRTRPVRTMVDWVVTTPI